MDQEQTPEQAQASLQKLHKQLSDTINAQEFFKTDVGLLFVEVVKGEVNKALRDITSDKYEKDHTGYVKRLADLQAHQNILKRLQITASPVLEGKIRERIEITKENA